MSDRPVRILTIDDERYVRESIVAYLEDSGFEMLEATNGREGINQFRKEKPDLVLCDLRMPEVDGMEVLEVITKESPDTPVIMISGAGLINDVLEALRLGAWDYLVKPITDLEVLEHTVVSVLRRAKLEQENKQYKDELEKANRELAANLATLRDDQEAGRRVQMQLLPSSQTQFGQYRFSHQVIPSLYLSGDFLDYFEIDDRYLGFYIADVSGHGASSAFVTILLKSMVNQPLRRYRNGEDQTILHPGDLLEILNTDVLSANLGKYLTMFYAVLDRQKNLLHYAVGGHFPRPVLSIDGEPKILPGEGFPIGLFEWAKYDTLEMNIPQNFTLAMFSDGLFELDFSRDQEDKEARLMGLCQGDNLSLDLLGKRLQLDKVTAAADDITLFLLHRNSNDV